MSDSQVCAGVYVRFWLFGIEDYFQKTDWHSIRLQTKFGFDRWQ